MRPRCFTVRSNALLAVMFARFREIHNFRITRIKILDDSASNEPRSPKERLRAFIRAVRGSEQLSRRAERLSLAKEPKSHSSATMPRRNNEHRDEPKAEERVIQHHVSNEFAVRFRGEAFTFRQCFVDRGR